MEDTTKQPKAPSPMNFLLYSLPNEEGRVQVVVKDETIWATQKAMALLFGVQVPAINKHLKTFIKKVNFLNLRLFPKWK